MCATRLFKRNEDEQLIMCSTQDTHRQPCETWNRET